MNRSVVNIFLSPVIPLIMLTLLRVALAQSIRPTGNAGLWVVESEGTATALPDVVYLMMKMEYQAARAADAVGQGEQQLSEFLAAVDNLSIPSLNYRVHNTVISPGSDREGTFSGFVYTRNIVFTIRKLQSVLRPDKLEPTIAQLEDLGARHNSHCVTCVGSG